MDNIDKARKEHSIATLKEQAIPYIEHLPLIISEATAQIRSPMEVAERLFAMFTVSIYCEGRNSGETWEDTQRYMETTNNIVAGRLIELLTAEETEFLNTEEPAQQALNKFGWRYECCHVLMWVLGLVDELGYPSAICDVASMANILIKVESLENLVETANTRPKSEILDAGDLIYRYHWACVDARIKNQAAPADLDEGVVYEWHYAFDWLVGAQDSANWDDIRPST